MAPRRLLPLLVLLLALPGCGIVFIDNFNGTESMKHFHLAGDFVPGGQLTVSIDVVGGYPVPVRVACYYEEPTLVSGDLRRIVFAERATLIGEQVLPPSSSAKPGDDAPKKTVSFPFSIDHAGSFFAACITPTSPENGMGESFVIESSPAAATQ